MTTSLSEVQAKSIDMLTIRLSRQSVEYQLAEMEEALVMNRIRRQKNPHYPSEEAMFEEFPHYKEQLDAYRAALADGARS